jgi:dTDP-L-rhamnose 4-epimerase
MSDGTVLVTGGAGFIGSHVVDELLSHGLRVRVYDSLEPQVHGDSGKPPAYLNPAAEFVRGDVRDREALEGALKGVDRIIHLAASVSSAQSMYQIEKYIDVNVRGTSTLLDLVSARAKDIQSLVVASSCTVYGEGAYACAQCGGFAPGMRDLERLARREWEQPCPRCGEPSRPVPTSEERQLQPATVYGLSKRAQEELCLIFGRIYGVRTLGLRYFGVYGPRQSLSNPYTGAVVNFLTRIVNGRAPLVFEDGRQSRDFIHVRDVARATALAVTSTGAPSGAYNVGTGSMTTVLEVIRALYHAFGQEPQSEVLHQWRAGDIRHCIADMTRTRRELGFEPSLSLEQGVRDVVEWSATQRSVDLTDQALEDLKVRSLSR